MPRPNLLLAAAAPIDLSGIWGTLELRTIKEAHERRRFARIKVLESTSIDGLRRALLEITPQYVQLIAHGDRHGLAFESEDGHAHIVAHEHLAPVLLAHRPSLEHVVVTACHSAHLARMLALGGISAVGMQGYASAAAAIAFSRGLHDAISARRSFEFAVGEGLRTVVVHGHSLDIELHLPEKQA